MNATRILFRKWICIIFVFGVLSSTWGCTPHPVSQAERAPIANDSIAKIIEKFRVQIAIKMEQDKIPGLAIAIVDDHDILWEEGFGYTDTNRKMPVTPSTLFSIQSMSKSFTATAAMFAAQDGLVNLDAPITDYLPEFHVNSIFEEHPEQKITLRILLSHTSGLPFDAPFGNNLDHPAYSFEQHIASISKSWLKFPVGSRYSYSNQGVDLAGYILQVKSGKPFTQYVQDRVLQPLGMTGSTLEINQARARQDRAIGHSALPLRPPVDFLIIPSGGVWTTAADMARYLQFHINHGALDGNQLLSQALAETMYTPPNKAASAAYTDSAYAQGITVNTRNGARHFQHGGGGFGFNSSMVWYPELKLGSVVLTNKEQPDGYYYQLSEDVLDSIVADSPSVYAERAKNTSPVTPAYPAQQGGAILSPGDLQQMIKSKRLPSDAAADSRRTGYVGVYVLTQFGIPIMGANLTDKNGQLYYQLSTFGTKSATALTEVQPGLFFDPQGDTLDLRGKTPIAQNYSLVKTNPHLRPLKYGFFALCGLLFLATIITWPGRAVLRKFRRKSELSSTTNTYTEGSKWLGLYEILAMVTSLMSLLCMVFVIIVPNMINVPWPRPYIDLVRWQYALLSLPFAGLALSILLVLCAIVAIKNRAWEPFSRILYLVTAMGLFAFNLVIIL